KPSPSGPRWAWRSVMRCRTAGSMGVPSRLKSPVMPHMLVHSLLADDTEIVRAQPGHVRQEQAQEVRPGCDPAGQRGSQRDPPQLDLAPGEQIHDLVSPDAPDVRVPRIAHVQVVPQ